MDHLIPFEKNPVPTWVAGMNFDALNMDANEGLIFARQLEFMDSTLYNKKYPNKKGRALFPVDYSVPNGAKTFTYKLYDSQGAFELITNYSDDFRSISKSAKEFTGKIESFGVNVEYSVQDIREAQMAGGALDPTELQTARDLWEEALDNIILNGLPNSNLHGILSHPNVPVAAVPVGGGAVTEWSGKTPTEILKDLNDMVSGIITLTKGVESADVIAMPLPQYEIINTTRMADGTDTTILEFFLRNNSWINRVEPWYKLAGAGTAGVDVMFAYRDDATVLQIVISQEFESFQPQQNNMAFKIPTHARTGGMRIRYPLSISIKEGI